jgi:hypothetical protein
MKVNKTKAQAFLDGLNNILDGGGFKGRYYWDDGVPRDEQDNLFGPSDEERLLCDWTGYLVFKGNYRDGNYVNDESFPKRLLINGVWVEPDLHDGWDYAHYDVEDLYRAWASDKVKCRFTISRDKQDQVEQALRALGVETPVFTPVRKETA